MIRQPDYRFPARRPIGFSAPRALFPGDAGTVEVVVERLDVVPGIVRDLTGLLAGAEVERADRFIRERDRHRFIVARGRLRQLLAVRLNSHPESVRLVYGAHGKPALAPGFAEADLRFNVSHSGDVAAYAFATGRDVGVDIEAVRDIPGADDIAARFFSRHESRAYRGLDARDRAEGFFNCWTRKEAFVKAVGEGVSLGLDRFDVSLAPGEPAKILRIDRLPGERCGWGLQSFIPCAGFIGAIVARTFADSSACLMTASS